jgi:hypothetical protein
LEIHKITIEQDTDSVNARDVTILPKEDYQGDRNEDDKGTDGTILSISVRLNAGGLAEPSCPPEDFLFLVPALPLRLSNKSFAAAF